MSATLDAKLLNEPPLLVLPSLAVALGLNEAIVAQQLHFRCRDTVDGWWRAGSRELRDELPFWSESTTKRALAELRRGGLVEARQEPGTTDRANRYRIDYEKLGKRVGRSSQVASVERVSSTSDRPVAPGQAGPIPIDRGKRKNGKREEGTPPDDFDAVVKR